MKQADDEATQVDIADAAEVIAPDNLLAGDVDAAEQPEGDSDGEDDGDELLVSIGEEPKAEVDEAEEGTPRWVKRVRRDRYRAVQLAQRQKREIEELRAQLSQVQPQAANAGMQPLPPKPKLADFDYDEDAKDKALDEWYALKAQHEKAEQEQRQQLEKAQQAWDTRVQAYEAGKAKLPVVDVDEAETLVKSTLNDTQLKILIDGAQNASLLIYALGKTPAKLQELAKLNSLSQFAFKAAIIEAEIKTMKRTAKPAPEGAISGTSPGAIGGGDATLERLRAEALKTGDMTKVVAYRRQLRAAS
jgi:hypothetical protein